MASPYQTKTFPAGVTGVDQNIIICSLRVHFGSVNDQKLKSDTRLFFVPKHRCEGIISQVVEAKQIRLTNINRTQAPKKIKLAFGRSPAL